MKRVSLEFRGRIAVVKLNHPEVLNALGPEMLADLGLALEELKNPANGARCLLMTGEGRAFCAGANLQAKRNREGDEGRETRRAGDGLRTTYHPLLRTLRDLDMPIVTAVNGAAAGVGMSFAMMGDIVCASRGAYFLQAFSRVGLVPDGGATFLLPRLIGWGRAMELSLLAERLPAEKAHEWGLVNRLFDDNDSLLAGALDIASRLAAGPRSLVLTRKAYWSTWQHTFEQQIALEAELQDEAGQTLDFAEGVSAFLEKREPRFRGE